MFPFVEGLILGLTMAIIFGPAQFTLLQTSIYRGLRAGFLIAIGIVLCDATMVFLSYMGIAQHIENARIQMVFSILGGLLMIVFGIVTYRQKVMSSEKSRELNIRIPGASTFLLKGYFLNIANPALWFFWITLVVAISSNYAGRQTAILSFFGGALLTIFVTDIGKVFIAQTLKRFITHRVIMLINHIVGVVLVLFGLLLIARVLFDVKLPTIA